MQFLDENKTFSRAIDVLRVYSFVFDQYGVILKYFLVER